MKPLFKVALLIAPLLLLTSCSTGATVAPTPAPTVTVTTVVLPCQTSQLKAVLGQEGGAAGSVGVTGMGFQNTSAAPCSLGGYPSLQMLDSNGGVIPTFISRGNIFSGATPANGPIVINSGQIAKFDMIFAAQTGYGNAYCPASSSVTLIPPGSTAGVTVVWKIQPYGGTVQALHCGELRVSPIYGP